MDGFETLIAEILEADGFWIRRNMKVPLSKEEKRLIDRPSSPRWEIDVLAYSASNNEVLAVECKSYLDSPGVNLADLEGGRHASRYKLFTEPSLRKVVLDCLATHLTEIGLCRPRPRIRLALAAGRVRGDPKKLNAHFAANGWDLFDPEWIRQRLQRASDGGYENSVATMVAKILLRKKKGANARGAG